MTLEARLQELIANHDHESAVTLAKAALLNEEVVDVVVEETTVTIETRRFRGVHRWRTDPDGNFAIEGKGTYTCTCDGVDLSFSMLELLPAARDHVVERLRERTASAPPTSTDAETGAMAQSDRETVTAAPERGADPASLPAGRSRNESDPGTASTERSHRRHTSVPDAMPGDGRDPDPAVPTAMANSDTPNVDDRSRTAWLSTIVQRLSARLP